MPRVKQRSARGLRNWKTIAVIAGTAVVAVLAILLIPGATTTPNDDQDTANRVLAVLDGDEITYGDVTRLQTRYYKWYRIWLTEEHALDEIINEELVYREAEREGYLPTLEEAEHELQSRAMRFGLTIEDFLALFEVDGISYDEYLNIVRRQMAIEAYLDSVIEVSEEEAREFYETLREKEEDTQPFEELESHIMQVLEKSKTLSLIAELRDKAIIEYVSAG